MPTTYDDEDGTPEGRCQRWRERRDSYRRPDEQIATRLYEVSELPDDATPRAFVERHHYSGSYPAARFRFGLHRGGEFVGAAVFSHPCRDDVLTGVFPGRAVDSVELGRLVLLDDVPGNGESWFVARCFERLRAAGILGVLSFSDPMRRTAADGRAVFAGHVGCVYQALNAVYMGRARRRTLRLLPDGRVFSARAISKIRARERGWEYAVAQLLRAGAAEPAGGDLREWLPDALARVTRTVRHPGNHKYAWAIDRRIRRVLPASLPYPKMATEAA